MAAHPASVTTARVTLGDCPPLETALVGFIRGLDGSAFDPWSRAAVSVLLRDQLVVQIASTDLQWSRQILDFTRARDLLGRNRVVVSGTTMCAAAAAFVNAIYGHGFDHGKVKHPDSREAIR